MPTLCTCDNIDIEVTQQSVDVDQGSGCYTMYVVKLMIEILHKFLNTENIAG